MSSTTPGLVCAHHHLYSALARGMPPPPEPPTGFLSILEQIWWRLDVALDLEMIRWSAMLAALEALESGTTAIIDHHESPNSIEGSLDVIADACAEVGVRISCAYGATERHGLDGAMAGLLENERFLRRCDRSPQAWGRRRGLVGVHAAFTCSQYVLEAAAGLAVEHGVGVHIHVAEGSDDVGAEKRLASLATPEWLLVHGVLLPDDHGLAGTIVHNPRSNMNNSVGYARPTRFSNPVALGTDGIGADMTDEFRLAYARLREDDVARTPSDAWGWVEEGWALFPEARDLDSVTWSYDGVDDPWKLAFTIGVRPVEVTIDGEVVVASGVATRVDGGEVRAKAAEQATRLFAAL